MNPKVRVEGVDKKSSKEQFENVTDKKVDILTGDQPKADPQKKAAKGEGTVPVEGRIWVKMLHQGKEAVCEQTEKPNLEKELESLQRKQEELNDSYLRSHAEYDNFRKRP